MIGGTRLISLVESLPHMPMSACRGTGGGAVERAGLENQYGLRVIVGSNPTLSVDIRIVCADIVEWYVQRVHIYFRRK